MISEVKLSSEPITFVIPGDLHLTEHGRENHGVAEWMVREVNELIRPDFVQFIGDNVQDATDEQFRLFDDLRHRVAVPHFALVGDHDVHDDPEASRFRTLIGETFGATTLKGFRFIRLNTQEGRPVGLSHAQIDWFRGQADSAEASGGRIVLFQHNYPYQIWEDYAGPGIDDWRAIVQTRRIAAIFTGHTHYGQVANDGRNISITTRSIGDPEGGPPGYTIVHAEGDDLAVTYRSVRDDGPVVLIAHPRATLLATGATHVVRGEGFVAVRTWSRDPLISARYRVDREEWLELHPRESGLWVGPLPGDRLSKAEHLIEAEVRDLRGRTGCHMIKFMVDPTGRYTAIPATYPDVRETAFCRSLALQGLALRGEVARFNGRSINGFDRKSARTHAIKGKHHVERQRRGWDSNPRTF